MAKYMVFGENGVNEAIDLGDERMGLKALQGFVGGYIEIHQRGKKVFIVDEDGLLKGKKRNWMFPEFVGTVVVTNQDGIQEGGDNDD